MTCYERPNPIGNFLVFQAEFGLPQFDFLRGQEQMFLFHNVACGFWYQMARQYVAFLSLEIMRMYSLFRLSFFIPPSPNRRNHREAKRALVIR